MGFDPNQFQLTPFAGVLVGRPVQICSTPQHQSKVIAATVDWANATFGGTQAVQFNINQGTTNPLDRIIGCYVNNSNCDDTVVLYFPDTQYTVSVAGNASEFVPVFTQTGICNLYHIGILNTFGDGSHKTTQITLTNFLTDSFNTASGIARAIALWQASGDGVAQRLITPTIGSISLSGTLNLSAVNTVPLIPAVVFPPGQTASYAITNVQIAILNAYNTAAPSSGTIGLDSVGADGVLPQVIVTIPTNLDYYPYRIMYSHDNLYCTADTSSPVNIKNTFACSAGFAQISFDYAMIPEQ